MNMKSVTQKRDAFAEWNSQMQKALIIEKLREKGCRITKQRLMLLDIILENDCSCCKEIYYKAAKIDNKIGTATVYRMINTLEEIGAINRKNMYKIACGKECGLEDVCSVELEDHTVRHLSAAGWMNVIKAGLQACGYTEGQDVLAVCVRQCELDGQ